MSQKGQFAVYLSDTPVILKQSMMSIYQGNVDPEQL